jgi:hypothetical protein
MKFLDWLRHTVSGLSAPKVDEVIGDGNDAEIDFEILSDPENPMYAEMLRRYHAQQAREERSDDGD